MPAEGGVAVSGATNGKILVMHNKESRENEQNCNFGGHRRRERAASEKDKSEYAGNKIVSNDVVGEEG